MVAHLPSTEKTYWIEVNAKNFSKTKKKWKLEISKNNIFDDRAKNKLNQIFSIKEAPSLIFDLYRGKIDSNNHYDFIESLACISESVVSMNKMSSFMNELTSGMDKITNRLLGYTNRGLTDKNVEVLACIKSIGRIINITSKRMENEIEIFSKLYSEGIYATEYLLLTLRSINNESQEVKENLNALSPIPEIISNTLNSITKMRESLVNLSGDYPVLREAKNQYIEVIDLLIEDFFDAKLMTENLILKISSAA